MGDLTVALERGWDGDSNIARAILLLWGKFRPSLEPFAAPEVTLIDKELDAGQRGPLNLLMAHGYVTPVTENEEDGVFAVDTSTVVATEAGKEALRRLDQLWDEHFSSRTKSLIERRRTVRRVLVEGIYHDRALLVHMHPIFTGPPYASLDALPWLQFAGTTLRPHDVLPELEYLAEHGLLAAQLVDQTIGLKPAGQNTEIIQYRLTKEGTDYVEHLGGDMPATPNQQEDDYHQTAESKSGRSPSFMVTNNFHAPVSNVHSGTGDLNVGIDPAAIGQFVAQLHAFAPSLVFSNTSEQAELAMTVEALAVEKNRTRAATLIERIRSLVSRASGPLKDIAIGVIDSELSKLTGAQ